MSPPVLGPARDERNVVQGGFLDIHAENQLLSILEKWEDGS